MIQKTPQFSSVNPQYQIYTPQDLMMRLFIDHHRPEIDLRGMPREYVEAIYYQTRSMVN